MYFPSFSDRGFLNPGWLSSPLISSKRLGYVFYLHFVVVLITSTLLLLQKKSTKVPYRIKLL